ncbi:MAG: hypothetical protein U0W65_10580 [Bacteroidia bacterium]
MNRPTKILLIILSVLFGLYLLIGGLLTLILGDRTETKDEREYKFVINNKTSDTLYIERLIKDISQDNLKTINGKCYFKFLPYSSQIYFWDNVIEVQDKTYEWPVNTKLTLIKNSETIDFVFNDTSLVTIQSDQYGNMTITRTIK